MDGSWDRCEAKSEQGPPRGESPVYAKGRAGVASTAEKETESGAEQRGLQGVESIRGGASYRGAPPQAGLKDWCRGGRGAERAAAVAAARLPVPEHAREPPRSPPAAPPAAPRAPPPGEPGTGAKKRVGEGGKRKGKDNRVSGWPRGLRCGVAAATAPGSRRPHPGSPPRVGFPQRSFSPAFAQIARTRRQSLAWPAGGEPSATP